MREVKTEIPVEISAEGGNVELDAPPRYPSHGRPSSVRYFALSTVALLVATVLAGWIVGHFATGKAGSFNWDSGAIAATAFATISLACATLVLAYMALDSAATSRDLAYQGAMEQWRRDRPAIVVTSFEFSQAGPSCSVGMRNVGLGPAVYLTAHVVGHDSVGRTILHGASLNDHFLGPGEQETVEVSYTTAEGDRSDFSKLEVTLVFLNRLAHKRETHWRRDQKTGNTWFKFTDDI